MERARSPRRRLPAGAGAIGALAVACAVAAGASHAAELSLGSATVMPGDSFEVRGSLQTDPGDTIAAVSLEIRFDATQFTDPPSCAIDPALAPGKSLVQSSPGSGVVRLGVLGINAEVIPDGNLFGCDFTVRTSAVPGEHVLAASAGASHADGSSAAITGESALVRVQVPCSDGLDNDGDGLVDYPADVGCASPAGRTESPQCQDGQDNDGDGRIDWDGGASALVPPAQQTDPDPQCGLPSKNREKKRRCGLGFEVALLLGPLAWLSGRRRKRRGAWGV